jgi:hypothetical protein
LCPFFPGRELKFATERGECEALHTSENFSALVDGQHLAHPAAIPSALRGEYSGRNAELVLGVPATSQWLKRGTLGFTKWRQLFLNSRSVCCRRSLPFAVKCENLTFAGPPPNRRSRTLLGHSASRSERLFLAPFGSFADASTEVRRGCGGKAPFPV